MFGLAAGRDQQLLGGQLLAALERQGEAVAARGGGLGLGAEPQLDPLLLERLGERLADRRRLAGEQRGRRPRPGSPSRRSASAPGSSRRRPGRRRGSRMLFGTSFIPVTSRLVQTPSRSLEPVDRRDRGADEPVATTIFSASTSSAPTLDQALARDPAVAADQLDAAVLEPGDLARVVPVGDDLVAPLERLGDVDLAGHRLARAPGALRPRRRSRRGAAASSRACRPSRSTRRRPARARRSRPSCRRRRGRRRRPRRPGRRRSRSRRTACSSCSFCRLSAVACSCGSCRPAGRPPRGMRRCRCRRLRRW